MRDAAPYHLPVDDDAAASTTMLTSAVALPAPERGQALRDRRGIGSPLRDPVGTDLVVAGLILLTVFFGATGMASSGELPQFVRPSTLSAMLATFSVAMAVVASGLAFVRWRITGEVTGYWLAVGLFVLGVFTIAFGEIRLELGLGATARDYALVWIRPASVLVVLGVFAKALQASRMDSATVRPLVMILTATGAVTTIAVLFQLLPVVSRFTVTSTLVTSEVIAPTLAYGALAAAWCAVSARSLWHGVRMRDDLIAWAGLVMFGLTLTELLYTASELTGDDLVLSAQLVRATTLTIAVAGTTKGLQRLFADRSHRLFRTTVSARSARARVQAHAALAEERAHEARNALMAIEGATTTLERFRHRLDPETRERLALAVTAEIGRLQRLVHQRTGTPYRISFPLADVVDQQLVLARAQGLHVLADLPPGLEVFGRPADVAEVLQNLLANARRHAPESPVTVRAVDHGRRVCVHVEDRGPGVSPDQRAHIFGRGARSDTGGGSGLGLYVSARLMDDQGGRLWVEDRPGGGASFVMCLPSPEHDGAT